MKKIMKTTVLLVLMLSLVLVCASSAFAETSVGDVCPDFSLTTLSGGTFRLSDYRGKVVFINMWATWCGPCVGEMPDIQRLSETYSDLVVLGVAVWDDESPVRSFIQEHGYTYTMAMDEQNTVVGIFPTNGIPNSIFIDPNGVVTYLKSGSMSYDRMETLYLDAKANAEPIVPDSGTCGEKLTWTLDASGLLVISGTGAMYDYNWNNVPWDGNGVKTVQIENGVTSIGRYAFYDCSRLTRVTIPDSVTSIGDYAFYDCSRLTRVTIPDSVTSIGDYVFCRCHSLTSVTIPSSVTSIGHHAFFNCSGLTSVTIPSSVTSIGHYAFPYCYSLTSVTIPSSVTSIGEKAFYNCTKLTEVYYTGSSRQWAGISIEEGNEHLTNAEIHYINILTLPASLNAIESQAFTGLPNVDAVSIPATVTNIADDAFDAGIVIIAPTGSHAETWAREHGFTVNNP